MAGQIEQPDFSLQPKLEASVNSNEQGNSSVALVGQYLSLIRTQDSQACRLSPKEIGGNIVKSDESIKNDAERESMAQFIGFTMWNSGLQLSDGGFSISESDFAKAAHDPFIPMGLRGQTDSMMYKLRGAAGPDATLTQEEFSKYVVARENSDDLHDFFRPRGIAVMNDFNDMDASFKAYDPSPFLGKNHEMISSSRIKGAENDMNLTAQEQRGMLLLQNNYSDLKSGFNVLRTNAMKLTDRRLDEVYAPMKVLERKSDECLK